MTDRYRELSNETGKWDRDDHPFPGEWSWWAGPDEEEITEGPFGSREEAIEAVEPGYVVQEAQARNIDLSRYFDVDRWVVDLEENVLIDEDGPDEYGDHGPLDEVTKEAWLDLQNRVRAVIRLWQQAHGYRLRGYYFADVRNVERVEEKDDGQPPDREEADG